MFLNNFFKFTFKNNLKNIQQRRITLNAVFRREGHYSPNAFEKRCLVWTGKYKSLEEVPNLVSSDAMERSRNVMRIRIANVMMLLTVVGCGIMVYSGKDAAKRGETVVKQNIDWHKAYNEQQSK